jgi:hypothetical protein
MSLWCGQAVSLAGEVPAADIVLAIEQQLTALGCQWS